MRTLIALVLFLIAIPAAAPSKEFLVHGDYPTIQQAIDAAMDRDAIEVDPGTYVENIDCDALFKDPPGDDFHLDWRSPGIKGARTKAHRPRISTRIPGPGWARRTWGPTSSSATMRSARMCSPSPGLPGAVGLEPTFAFAPAFPWDFASNPVCIEVLP